MSALTRHALVESAAGVPSGALAARALYIAQVVKSKPRDFAPGDLVAADYDLILCHLQSGNMDEDSARRARKTLNRLVARGRRV